MDAIQLLTTRSSTPRLQAPAPSAEDWAIIQQAAVRAPDHADLRPWSFMVCDNDQSLAKLGEVFAKAALADDADIDEAKLDKIKNKPFRAPVVIVCVAKCQEHPKVPRVEQVASAACAVMAMQQAAFALGYGGMWRTGGMAHNSVVKSLLGLQSQDEIVGFLYLGTAQVETVIKAAKPAEPHFVAFAD